MGEIKLRLIVLFIPGTGIKNRNFYHRLELINSHLPNKPLSLIVAKYGTNSSSVYVVYLCVEIQCPVTHFIIIIIVICWPFRSSYAEVRSFLPDNYRLLLLLLLSK